MLLEKFILKNFRQFHGEQELHFSCDPIRNVTLIHAANGVGKTTILNALLWCFYKSATPRFEDPDKILCLQAIAEDQHDVSVQVFFDHDGEKYCVSRRLNERYGDESFEAFRIIDGNFELLDSPSLLVEAVIPKEMSRYFFFDGEYAETFSSKHNRREVRDAVENMLGCQNAVQALTDLKSIKKGIEREIAALTKNSHAEALQTEIDKLNRATTEEEVKLIEIEAGIETVEKIVDEISASLKGSEGAKEIEERREKQERYKEKASKKLNFIKANETSWIHKYSISLLSKKLINTNLKVFDTANIKGLIPSKVAETFVTDILESHNCICDRTFENGSDEERAIKGLMRDAGKAVVNDRLMAVRERIGMLTQANHTALGEYKEISRQLIEQKDKIHGCELEIKECHNLLQGSKVSEIAEREHARESKQTELKDLVEQRGRLNQATETRAGIIEKKVAQRDKALQHNDRANFLQKKTALLNATTTSLARELDSYRELSRSKIISQVNRILEKTARRDYVANIDDSFNLQMFYGKNSTPVAKSSGENQLLSLAFIASLVGFSADRRAQDSHLLKPGTMAPLMLDSPFGQLDPSYRLSTADFLPTLTGQVILLISQSQGDDDVINALQEKIGLEYVLISHNIASRGEKPSDLIQLRGQQIECSVFDRTRDFTEIKKIA